MLSDEKTLSTKYRVGGFLGPVSSSFTLAWLASHRGRLRTFLLGGKRLSVLVVWDTEGRKTVERDDVDVEAIRQVVYGSLAEPEERDYHDHTCCPPDDCCGGPCAAHPCWDLTT